MEEWGQVDAAPVEVSLLKHLLYPHHVGHITHHVGITCIARAPLDCINICETRGSALDLTEIVKYPALTDQNTRNLKTGCSE